MSRNAEKRSYTIRQENWAQKRKILRNYTVPKLSETDQTVSKSHINSSVISSSNRKVRSNVKQKPDTLATQKPDTLATQKPDPLVAQKFEDIEHRLKSLETYLQQIIEELLTLKSKSAPKALKSAGNSTDKPTHNTAHKPTHKPTHKTEIKFDHIPSEVGSKNQTFEKGTECDNEYEPSDSEKETELESTDSEKETEHETELESTDSENEVGLENFEFEECEDISDTDLAFILEEPESNSKQKLMAPKLKPKEV